jgi:TonB family protein
MTKKSLLSGTVLSCLLFTGLGVASVAAKPSAPDLPRPVSFVAPEDVPSRFANTTVRVSMTLDENGRPSNIRVLAPGSGYLERSVVAAVAQWRFTPMVKNGVPVTQDVILPLTLKAAAL